jgi:hypothetical protein
MSLLEEEGSSSSGSGVVLLRWMKEKKDRQTESRRGNEK